MADTTTELEVLDEIVDVLGGQSGQHKTVVPVLEDIRDLLGGGGGGGGYNPSLSVGRADALTGADETAQWTQRESAGSGVATVRGVQGASVVWNQLVESMSAVTDIDGITTSYDEVSGLFSIINLSRTTNYASGSTRGMVIPSGEVIVGHKYVTYGALPEGVILSVAGGLPIGAIYTPNESSNIHLRVTSNYDFVTAHPIGDVTTFHLMFTDLTVMFGAGNEPTTVAEFERMYPAAYYPYSAPTLKPVQIAGIASTDAYGGELDAIEWTAQTLRAAGSVRDELTADELVTRVGVADADFSWPNNPQGPNENGIYYISAPTGVSGGGAFTANLSSNIPIGTETFSTAEQREFACNGATLFYRFPFAGGTPTLAQAIADMRTNNAVCYYPTTPTTTPISPALPMTYRVEQGGTESIIVPAGEVSAAPVITVAEGESAAELVMDALACIATPDGPVATANHSVGTYLTMQGKLYKVTSAIASGEQITSGTNVTETTVMAELLALAN